MVVVDMCGHYKMCINSQPFLICIPIPYSILYSKTNYIAYKFGRLTEILPEEVFEADISSELESRKLEFGRLFDEDLKSVKQLLKNNNLTIEIKHFQESDACVISKRFLII